MALTKNSPAVANGLVRTKSSLELRLAGLKFREIAEQTGLSISGAHAQVAKALEETRKDIAEKADELRALLLLQLDEMHRAWWPLAIGEEAEGNPVAPNKHALDRILRIMDRKMILLGLKDAAPGVDPLTAALAMREKAKAYESMGVAELSRLFAERIKSPIVIQGEAKPIDSPPDTAGDDE